MDIMHEVMDFDFDTRKVQETHFHQNLEILYVLDGAAEIQICLLYTSIRTKRQTLRRMLPIGRSVPPILKQSNIITKIRMCIPRKSWIRS